MERGDKQFNNRLLYSLISLILIIVVIGGVYAVDTTKAWHSTNQIDFSTPISSLKLTGSNQAIWAGWNNPLWLEETNHAAIVYNDPTSKKGFMIGFHGLNDVTYFGHTTDSWSTAGYLGAITGEGKVGIGTASPSYKLHVVGDIYANGGWLRTSGSEGWYSESYGGGWHMTDTTWIRAYNSKSVYTPATMQAGSFIYDSDISLKENIKPLTNSLVKVNQLQGVSFDWKKDGRKSIGLIAQDVEKVLPELVHNSPDGLKSVEYGNLVALLIEAVKEQDKKIQNQQQQINELKSQLNK